MSTHKLTGHIGVLYNIWLENEYYPDRKFCMPSVP